MSGASPQGPGVGTGPFPGCQQPVLGGGPGVNSWHIPPTGTDENNCPTGGSLLTADELNGLQQAMNCILTKDGREPLPLESLCANPCMLYEAIVEIATEIATDMFCNIPEATAAQKTNFENNPQNHTVVICLNGSRPVRVTGDCFGIVDGNNGGGNSPLCEVSRSGAGYTVDSGSVWVNTIQTEGSQTFNRWVLYETGDNFTPGSPVIGGSTTIPSNLGPLVVTDSYSFESGQGQTTAGTIRAYCAT